MLAHSGLARGLCAVGFQLLRSPLVKPYEPLALTNGNRRRVDTRRRHTRDGAKVSDGGGVVVQQKAHRDGIDLVVAAAGALLEHRREPAHPLDRYIGQMQGDRISVTIGRERVPGLREDLFEFEESRGRLSCWAQ